MKNERICVFLSVAALSGILLSFSYVGSYNGHITFSGLVTQLSGSQLEFHAVAILGFAMRLTPMLVLEMFLGIELYRHFCVASVFVFSRCTNRQRWYWREILSVGGQVFLFQVVSMTAVIVTSGVKLDVEWDIMGMVLCFYHLLLFSLWSMAMAVLVNVLALKFGSSISFLVVMMLQAAGTALLWLGSMFEDGTLEQAAVLIWNPMARLVLGWQRSIFPQVVEQPVYENFYLEASLLIMLFVNGIVLVFGAVMIKRQELLITDYEIGVM